MASIFTKIINGEIPSYKIAENDKFIAFLDIRPLQKGHTLVVPKKEVDYIFDHEDALLQDLIVFSKKVGKAVEAVIPCKRIGVSVIGIEVPHTHVHLIPINSIADMDFTGQRPSFTAEEMAETAALIKAAYDASNGSSDTYKKYLALLLIYTANTSDGLSESESNHIKNEVGNDVFAYAKEYFDSKSEVEVIEEIDKLSDEVGRDKRDEVLADLREIIEVDNIEKVAQENILRMLNKLI